MLASGPSRRLLDLGCGTGEHSRYLVDQGFEVVGVDASVSMLEKARDRPLPPGLEYVEGDLTRLAQIVEGAFGGAICLGNTLPHLRESSAARSFFCDLRTLLEPGAPLILQLLNYERVFERDVRYLPPNFSPDEGGEIVFLRLMKPLENGDVLFFPTTLRLDPGADPPLEVKASKQVHLRGWRAPEIEEIVAECGFAERRLLGGFGGEAYDPLVSPDLVLIAR